MHNARRSTLLWGGVALVSLLLAFLAYGSHAQGWMSNGVAVPPALAGVIGFAGAALVTAHGRRSSRD